MDLIHQTERLTLRVLLPKHSPMVLDFYLRNKEYLEPFEPARHPGFYTMDFQKANLNFEYNSFLKHTYLRVWIFLREDASTPIGTVCFSNFLKGAFCSGVLGYKLDQDYCGHGYMTEALSYLIPIAQQEYHLHRIEAMVLLENDPSIRLLSRLNFQQEGILHGFARIQNQWKDHLLFAMLST